MQAQAPRHVPEVIESCPAGPSTSHTTRYGRNELQLAHTEMVADSDMSRGIIISQLRASVFTRSAYRLGRLTALCTRSLLGIEY